MASQPLPEGYELAEDTPTGTSAEMPAGYETVPAAETHPQPDAVAQAAINADKASTDEAQFGAATSGLDDKTYNEIHNLPGGSVVAPVVNQLSRIPEALQAAPQYVANKFDEIVPGNLANTGLEMLMANAGEGSMEGAAGDAVKGYRDAKAADRGDFSRIAPETPAAPPEAPVDVAQVNHQRSVDLAKMLQDGYDSDYIAKQFPGIDKDALDAAVTARNKGQPYQVGQVDTPRNPLQADPTQDGTFDAEARNQAELGDTKPDPNNPLTQQAQAFTPSAEPTPADLFKSDAAEAAVGPMTDKLQAEADAWQAQKDQVPAGYEPVEPEPENQTSTATNPNMDDADKQTAYDHAQAVHSHIEDLTQDWANKPSHVVYPTVDDIDDPRIKAAFADDPDSNTTTLGMYGNDGRVHLVASNFDKPEDVTATLFHEALGHHGLASKFGKELDTHLQNWYDNSSGTFRQDVDGWLKTHPDAYHGQNRVVRAAEEVLAERSESGKATEPGLLQRITQTVRQYARRAGIVKDFSDKDIDAILNMAHNATIHGADSVAANGFKFSRKYNPERLDHRGEDDALTYDDGSKNEFRRFSTEELREATSNDRPDGRTAWPTAMVDSRRGSRAQVAYDKSFWDQKRKNLTPEENDGKIVQPDGRTGWQSAMVDQRRGSRAQRAADQSFWQGKRVNKTPEEWEAENQGKFATRTKTPADVYKNVNLDNIKTEADVHDLIDKLVESNPQGRSVSHSETIRNAQQMGLRVDVKGQLKSGNTIIHPLPDLAARVQALRQLHVNGMEKAQEFWAKLQDNYDEATHANAAAHMAKLVHIDSILRNDRSVIGRALNAFKIVTSSNKKAGAILKELQESGGPVGDLGDKDSFMKFMAQYMANVNTKNVVGATQVAQKLTKPYWWEPGLVIKNASMLSGLPTQFKNTKDNIGLMRADLMDHTGAMLAGSVSKTEMRARIAGLGQSIIDWHSHKEALDSVLSGGRTGQSTSSKFASGGTDRPYVPIASHSLALLESADHIMKNANMGVALRGLGVRQAEKAGLKGDAAYKQGIVNALNATPAMIKQAEEASEKAAQQAKALGKANPAYNAMIQHAVDLAERARQGQALQNAAMTQAKRNLLQDSSSAFTKGIEGYKNIRPNMTAMEQTAAVMAHVIFPFVRVADRTLARMVERSPLGFAKVLNKELADALETGDTVRRDIAYSRAVLGSMIVAHYMYAGYVGQVTGLNPNYQKTQAEGAAGYMPGAVDDGDRYTDATSVGTSINPLDLHNSQAVAVASAMQAHRAGAPLADTMKRLAQAIVGIMNTQSVLADVTPYGEAASAVASGDPQGKAATVGASLANQFVPALMRQGNQTFDDTTKRDATGDKSFLSRAENAAKAATPGLSKTLPVSYDNFGQANTQGKSFTGTSNFNMKSDDPTIKEMYRLEQTQPDKALVTMAPTTPWKTADGGSIKLTDFQRSEFQRRSGTYFKSAMDQYVSNPAWAQASVAVKKEYVKETLKAARAQAKAEMLQDGTVPASQETPPDKSDESIK